MKQIRFFTLIGLSILCGAPQTLALNRDGYTDIWWRNTDTGDNSGWAMIGTNYSTSFTLAFERELAWKIAATGDFNKDGDLDLLWRNNRTGENAVWLMYGSYFRAAQYIQSMTDTNWDIVATGYFDPGTDKSVDILWRNKVTGDNAIWFMEGTTFRESRLIDEVPDLNWKVGGTGDFNNDGSTDILWRNLSTGESAVWLMQGSTFAMTAWLPWADAAWDIAGTGYFDSDNKIDILWRHRTNGENAIWLMDGTSLRAATSIAYAAPSWQVAGTGDCKASFDPSGRDNLPDLWERRFLGTLSPADGEDPDGDSQSNLTEYTNGSDPTINNTLPTLGNALDANALQWTTGGNAPWIPTTSEHMVGPSGGRSGPIDWGQSSWMEVRVLGPGTVYFWFKVSSGFGDYLTVTCGNHGFGMCGEQPWQYFPVSVDPGIQTVRWDFTRIWGGMGGQNAGFIDGVSYVPGTGSGEPNPANLNEAVDNQALTFWGVGDWYYQTNTTFYGGDAARNYYAASNETKEFSTSATGPGRLTFYWKVSSETDHDFLRFYIDGQEQAAISGEVDWQNRAFDVGVGSRTFAWRYRKDYSLSGGADAGWVDNVVFIPDVDNDGLSDAWEIQYFGNITSQNGFGDYDADGVTNLQEYLNGTNPAVPELEIKIASPRKQSLLP